MGMGMGMELRMAEGSGMQALCRQVLQERYLQPGESDCDAVFQRVAAALAEVERPPLRGIWRERFLAHLRSGGLGAGRIMAGAGVRGGERCSWAHARPTLINCFVERGQAPSALESLAHTLACGGGVGLDLRGVAALAFLDGVERRCRLTDVQTLPRAAAVMVVLQEDHPDLPVVLQLLANPNRPWPHTTVSVAMSDAFLRGARQGHPAQRALWRAIVQAAWWGGRPGLLFIDRIRSDNNLRAQEAIDATNPCGEQPLPAGGSCNLGPLVLPRFIRHPWGWGGPAAVDRAALRRAVRTQVRLLDNALDITPWPLASQRDAALRTRRLGVGLTGLADALLMLGLPYGSPQARVAAAGIVRLMRDEAYAASIDLATERSPYPAFHAATVLEDGTFASRLPAALKAEVA